MVTPEKIRHLPLSAASGLVIVGDYFYVIADDDLHISVFSLRDEQFHQRIPLFNKQIALHLQEQMCTDSIMRKKHKPDLEALAWLPEMPDFPHGALLALGSGSKRNRQRAVIIPFQADGSVSTQTTIWDLSALYASLPVDDLNIEGAFIANQQLVLMQRGNSRHAQSALVFVPLGSLSPCDIQTIHYTLPTIAGIPLGFTDGLYLPSGDILFSAVAENTDDSYNDGACVGAALGGINAQGELLACELLSQPCKVEGIAMATGDITHLYMVTDADDANIPAVLYRATVPGLA